MKKGKKLQKELHLPMYFNLLNMGVKDFQTNILSREYLRLSPMYKSLLCRLSKSAQATVFYDF